MLDWPNPVLKFRQLMILDTDLAAMRSMVDSHEAKMSPHLVKMMRSHWPAETLTDAITERKAVANRMWRLMKEFDFLLTPATTGFPPLADRQDTAADIERPLPVFSCVANMTGQPAASLPIGHGASGLPIGLQIMGKTSSGPRCACRQCRLREMPTVACALARALGDTTLLPRRPAGKANAGLCVMDRHVIKNCSGPTACTRSSNPGSYFTAAATQRVGVE